MRFIKVSEEMPTSDKICRKIGYIVLLDSYDLKQQINYGIEKAEEWEWLDESPTTADASVLVEALQEITKPVEYMRKRLKDGEKLNGMYALQLSDDAGYLKDIAAKAIAQYSTQSLPEPDKK